MYFHYFPCFRITHDLSPENQNANDVDLIHTNEEDAHLNNYERWRLSHHPTGVTNGKTDLPNNLYHSLLQNNKLRRGSGGKGGVVRGLRIEDVERISKGVVTLDLSKNGKQRAKDVLLYRNGDVNGHTDDVFVDEDAEKNIVQQVRNLGQLSLFQCHIVNQ